MVSTIEYTKTILPWTGDEVRMIGNLYHHFAERLPKSSCCYLPRSITLFIDREVDDSVIEAFLAEMASQLHREFSKRMERLKMFVELRLFSLDELHQFLTSRRHKQPWAIYYSAMGGLGTTFPEDSRKKVARGVIPCSSMLNHGVAWTRSDDGSLKVWLATARKEGQDWNWDSDIGHESAHSAFAQVPLFAQGVQLDSDCAKFSALHSVKDLDSGHLARMAYMYSEIAVVAIRGESRPTETGLPVAERSELVALLKLSHELMPSAGFQRALDACYHTNGFIDVNHGNEIFEMAAPVMRIVPYLTSLTKTFNPPSLTWYRMINCKFNPE